MQTAYRHCQAVCNVVDNNILSMSFVIFHSLVTHCENGMTHHPWCVSFDDHRDPIGTASLFSSHTGHAVSCHFFVM